MVGELSMDEKGQSAEVPENAQHQGEEVKVHEDNGQEPVQPEEQEMVQEEADSPRVASDKLDKEPAIHEEQEIIPGEVQEKQQQAVVEQSEPAMSDMNSQVAPQEQNEGKVEQAHYRRHCKAGEIRSDQQSDDPGHKTSYCRWLRGEIKNASIYVSVFV